jgi:hypothetical protein
MCGMPIPQGEEYWNSSTRAWYCQECADGINKSNPNLCIHHTSLPNDKMMQWVNDLQSGMYINCVYCGHRYGPKKDTPAVMADVLKAHIRECPAHPLSKALTALEAAERALDDASGVVDPGDDEDIAYESELKTVRDTIKEIREGG